MRARGTTAAALSAALLSAVAAAPAAAQSRIDDGPGRAADISQDSRQSEAESQRVMNAYARCVLVRSRRAVLRFLAAPPGSPEARRLGGRIATSDCLSGGMLVFQSHLFRGALFEALYMADFRGRAAADFAAAPRIAYAVDSAPASTLQAGMLTLHEFADCVVRAAPAQARALILSDVTTREEVQAFRSLGATFNSCLVRGAEVRFSRPVLRGLIAESLYRLTAATAASATAAGVSR
jgi:hypothetical protein